MPTRSSKKSKREGTPHDFAVTARQVVEQAIGEKLDGSPLDDPYANKNPRRVAVGVSAGKIGGPARAAKLSPVRRRAIAVKAAKVRWGTPTLKKEK
jgi:hypothetical protein